MEKENKKKLQERYVEFQIMEQQMKHIENQVDALSGQIQELMITTQGIEDLEKVKPGTEILVPLAGGIFLKAELKDSSSLLLNVGSNTVVTKSAPDAKEFINKQLDEIKGAHQQLIVELQKLAMKSSVVEREIVDLSR